MDAQGAVNAAYDTATNRLRATFSTDEAVADDQGEEENAMWSRLLVNGELRMVRV